MVRRRLAQKIEFLSSDIAAQIEPAEDELKAYLGANPKQFQVPAHISFIQIYLNADRRGASLNEDARDLLLKLEQGPVDFDTSRLGDPFMFEQIYQDLPDFSVSRLFGREFMESLFDLPVNEWQGPIRSGLGFHLVRVDSVTPPQQPELGDIRDKVQYEWMAEQRRKMDKALYQGLRQKYDIVLPDMATNL